MESKKMFHEVKEWKIAGKTRFWQVESSFGSGHIGFFLKELTHDFWAKL